MHRTIYRPFEMLVKEPILVLITIYMCLVYGLIYALFEVFPIIFVGLRGWEPRFVGLSFIGEGIGTTIGAAFFYFQTKKYYEPVARKWRGFPPAEARLPVAMVGAPLLVVSILWLCWSGAYPSVHWIVPELAAIPLGTSIALIFIAFQASNASSHHHLSLTLAYRAIWLIHI
jgi:DHA1 family multidrug resistance protein-like MFS transporter